MIHCISSTMISEWGAPCRDDKKLFEFVLLEGAQAGLSWITILRKREAYRRAFADFEVEKVAAFTEQDIERCVAGRWHSAQSIKDQQCCLQCALLYGGAGGIRQF